MALINKLFFWSLIVFFVSLFLKPIAGFLVVSKNTMIWGLLQSGIVWTLTIFIVSIFLSTFIYIAISAFLKND